MTGVVRFKLLSLLNPDSEDNASLLLEAPTFMSPYIDTMTCATCPTPDTSGVKPLIYQVGRETHQMHVSTKCPGAGIYVSNHVYVSKSFIGTALCFNSIENDRVRDVKWQSGQGIETYEYVILQSIQAFCSICGGPVTKDGALVYTSENDSKLNPYHSQCVPDNTYYVKKVSPWRFKLDPRSQSIVFTRDQSQLAIPPVRSDSVHAAN